MESQDLEKQVESILATPEFAQEATKAPDVEPDVKKEEVPFDPAKIDLDEGDGDEIDFDLLLQD